MLINRPPRRGRNAPPLDVVRGAVVETYIAFQVYRSGQIESRDYVIAVDGVARLTVQLERHDDDRRAWEEHWRIRRQVRRERQGREVAPDE